MFNLKRLSSGVYRTDDGLILIKRVLSQRNSGKKTEKETLWTVQILNYELPMAEETLKEAKYAASKYIKNVLEDHIREIFKIIHGGK